MARAGKGISLQWLVVGAIVCSMLLLSAILVSQSYQSNKQALIIATSEAAQQLSKTINEKVQRLTGPAQSALQILSHDPLLQAQTLPQRIARLPVLAETLNANEMLSAIYAGYDNGEFFLIRKLSNPLVRSKYKVPEAAKFMLQSITEKDGKMVGEWTFYDQQLQLLKTEIPKNYDYDPRRRGWYIDAKANKKQVLTAPYLFFTTREIGITLAQKAYTGTAIIGMDASVADLSAQLASLKATDSTELAIIDPQQKVLAYTHSDKMITQEGDSYRLSSIAQLNVDALTQLAQSQIAQGEISLLHSDNTEWFGLWMPVTHFGDNSIRILIATPADELLAGAKDTILNQALWTAGITFLMLILGMLAGSRIGRAFHELSHQVSALSGFDFSSQIEVRSDIREAKKLGQVVNNMSQTIGSFQAISTILNRETDLEKMLDGVLTHLVNATGMSQGAVYLYQSETQLFEIASQTEFEHFPLILKADTQDDKRLIHSTLSLLETPEKCLITPLKKRDQGLEGLLIMRWEQAPENKKALLEFISEISGSAAVAIETRRLINGQRELIEGILRLLADSIDAKSPYTSGHCDRVPQLATLLVNQLEARTSGVYADFKMSDEEHEEFRIAAWLHDCGKILSQEHVIDKATKLETIYNRIHEIRTRFEVLWRDAEIDYWQKLHAGGDGEQLKAELTQTQQQLQDDYHFIANSNVGGESMNPESIARINTIGDRLWLRNFDNRIGLSQDELNQLANTPEQRLPARERLLSDRPEHIVPWQEGRKPPVQKDDPNNIWQFDMPLPQYSFNFGERYNLSVRFGTLTEEERFKINEHIVHTIMMLSALPLPDHLKRVPIIAGNHHERADGKGYPRKLPSHQMSVQEKVMGIADIFEALTASDRPYKKPKTLSQALSIMVQMSKGGHIEANLFKELLAGDGFIQYCQQFLQPEQLDHVDFEALIQSLETESA
ncbi:HD domain-containing protein [Oceanospirillum multiglobuliferum]|uniref:HD-GYP domain-containing protein n=1 Tax=Oceanospirillum multiglobuliferum TaxID=64969 RepID=A0A1T4N363_9GAMM|nr:HD domain-containing phosphohydrolase [Oceanospirillum multiglobuliferum]OPX55816.1 hypothetical protein BTE48_06335 [Oceanospirillum multiglobuliferum]SJZ73556.1 HD domain-containing protein [Oceanospirillum multiglobuliferum]